MTQVPLLILKKRRMTSTDVKSKADLAQHNDFNGKEEQKYTVKEVSQEIIKALNSEVYVSHKDVETLHSLNKLKDILAFLRNFPRGRQAKYAQKMETPRPEHPCSHLSQIEQLKKKLESKNQMFIKLSEGYQEAKDLFQKQLAEKESELINIKKEVCQLKAQNDLLKQKVTTLVNYRQDKVKVVEILQKKQLKSHSNNQLSLQNSRKNSCQQINDLSSAAETKPKGSLSSQKQTNQAKKLIRKTTLCQTEGKKIYCPFNVTPITDFQESSEELGQKQSQKLMHQINQLRDNQSKLLDRLFQRDEMISQLLKIKNKFIPTFQSIQRS